MGSDPATGSRGGGGRWEGWVPTRPLSPVSLQAGVLQGPDPEEEITGLRRQALWGLGGGLPASTSSFNCFVWDGEEV